MVAVHFSLTIYANPASVIIWLPFGALFRIRDENGWIDIGNKIWYTKSLKIVFMRCIFYP
jgi:hypothetical protein